MDAGELAGLLALTKNAVEATATLRRFAHEPWAFGEVDRSNEAFTAHHEKLYCKAVNLCRQMHSELTEDLLDRFAAQGKPHVTFHGEFRSAVEYCLWCCRLVENVLGRHFGGDWNQDRLETIRILPELNLDELRFKIASSKPVDVVKKPEPIPPGKLGLIVNHAECSVGRVGFFPKVSFEAGTAEWHTFKLAYEIESPTQSQWEANYPGRWEERRKVKNRVAEKLAVLDIAFCRGNLQLRDSRKS